MKRRSFMQSLGLGGLAAASMPVLPSLLSDGDAQALSYDRVVFVVWSHGVYLPLWHPTVEAYRDVAPGVRSASMATARQNLYIGDSLRGLEHKVSLLQGVSMLGAWGHTHSVLTASERGEDVRHRWTTTAPISIDNVLARSSAVYDVPPAVDVLRMATGAADGQTHSYVDHEWLPTIEPAVARARMFDGFTPGEAPPAGPSEAEVRMRQRLAVVQQTLRQYRTLQSSGRLALADRLRFEATLGHFAREESALLAQLDAPAAPPVAACELPGPGSKSRVDDQIELFVRGLSCNRTRIGYWKLGSTHAEVNGAHQAHSSANQNPDGLYTGIMRRNLSRLGALLRGMDAVVEGNGKTLLDNSLVVVTSDMATSVPGEHPGVDAPFLIAGGLGGKFRMGEVIDFRDHGHFLKQDHGQRYYGGPTNELFISIMRSFGLGPEDWDGPGFGEYGCSRDATCTNPYGLQSRLVDYYARVHSSRRSPGAELPYFRVGA